MGMGNDKQHQEDINKLARPLGRLVMLLEAKGVLSEEEVELVVKAGADHEKLKDEIGEGAYEEQHVDLSNETVMDWFDELRALDAVDDAIED